MKGQLLIDFLSQPGPQVAVQETRRKHTEFAEELGDLAERWLHQQRELERQVRGAPKSWCTQIQWPSVLTGNMWQTIDPDHVILPGEACFSFVHIH